MNIEVKQADITKIEVDAIVNAANSSLLGGSGVDGAIHKMGGREILEDCQKIRAKQGGCKVGQAVITRAGNLPAKYVIHTVGPVWNGGNNNEVDLLKQCYINSLRLAVENKVDTIAFPNISTGIYKFPKKLAAETALNTVLNFLESMDANTTLKVLFICYDLDNYTIYRDLL